jgi:hypothetical protein
MTRGIRAARFAGRIAARRWVGGLPCAVVSFDHTSSLIDRSAPTRKRHRHARIERNLQLRGSYAGRIADAPTAAPAIAEIAAPRARRHVWLPAPTVPLHTDASRARIALPLPASPASFPVPLARIS